MMHIDGSRITLPAFAAAIETAVPLEICAKTRERVAAAHAFVDVVAAGPEPVYGLNTGLGARLDQRIPPEDIGAFQSQIIQGRAVACGDPLPEETGRGVLLSRIVTAALGCSGMSGGIFDYLVAVYRSGLSPVVPEFGSIGASDLVQNAHVAMAVCGQADVWMEGTTTEAASAFARLGLSAPKLRPKDGLALINHSGTSVALAGRALHTATRALAMMKSAALLAYEGYAANTGVLDPRVNTLRTSPGQESAAAEFLAALDGSRGAPRRIQEALSFRTAAVLFGATDDALQRAVCVFEDELNGTPDSPAILSDGAMLSTANYMTPALALALENLSLALVGLAHASVQRQQKLMNPDFSALPRYLAAPDTASAGFVPSQKTAASLYAEIKSAALPALPDAGPVSDGVEDVVSTTPLSARKLSRQLRPFEHLAALEALVAAQAMDLRGLDYCGLRAKMLHGEIRKVATFVSEDRMLGGDINAVRQVLQCCT